MMIALLFIILGVTFFAQAAGLIPAGIASYIWPILLIVLGLGLLSHKTFGHSCNEKDCWRCREVSLDSKGNKRRS